MSVLKRGFIFVLTMISLLFLGGCGEKMKVGSQLEKPRNGEEIAVMTTSKGVIKMRFFQSVAPKAVENFKTHAKNGYYNGLLFHRVINNFMIQTGDPNGNGTGGKSIWGSAFEDEFSDKVLNIRGAVAMANSGPNTNGSQFFINQTSKDNFVGWDRLKISYRDMMDFSKITDEVEKLYDENGGNPYLDGAFSTQKRGHTVFAQVFEGMNVVDSIASVETDYNDKPKSDIKIEKIEFEKYEG